MIHFVRVWGYSEYIVPLRQGESRKCVCVCVCVCVCFGGGDQDGKDQWKGSVEQEQVSGTLARRVVLLGGGWKGGGGGGVAREGRGGEEVVRDGGLLRAIERVKRRRRERKREKEYPGVGVGKKKKKKPQDILIDRLLTACTKSVYPTFQRANYLLPYESWRSFRPVGCAEHQHSSLPARTHCDRSWARGCVHVL